MRAEFEVESFEISVPRARFARDKLGIKVHTSTSNVSGLFDVFFSAHVLEHVPSVKEAIDLGMSLLKPGGLFVAFTPNGSAEYRDKDPRAWNKLWGLVHPNFIDANYYKKTFAGKQRLISSSPHPILEIESWKDGQGAGNKVLPLDGHELLLVAKK